MNPMTKWRWRRSWQDSAAWNGTHLGELEIIVVLELGAGNSWRLAILVSVLAAVTRTAHKGALSRTEPGRAGLVGQLHRLLLHSYLTVR